MKLLDNLNGGVRARLDEGKRQEEADRARRLELKAIEAARAERAERRGGGSGIQTFMAQEVLHVVRVFDPDPREG